MSLRGAVEFSTPPFDEDIEITGHPILRVAVSLQSPEGSTPTDIDIFATLRHINAAGKEGRCSDILVYQILKFL